MITIVFVAATATLGSVFARGHAHEMLNPWSFMFIAAAVLIHGLSSSFKRTVSCFMERYDLGKTEITPLLMVSCFSSFLASTFMVLKNLDSDQIFAFSVTLSYSVLFFSLLIYSYFHIASIVHNRHKQI
jgi:hypothetical protein